MKNTDYLMDHAGEGTRLEKKTDHELVTTQLAMCGLSEGMRALDAGAATGAVSRAMARIVGKSGSVVAFDGSADRLAKGKTIARQEDIDNIDFIQGNIYDAPLPTASCDFSWARFFFEYLDRPREALAEMHRVTKPGGTIVLADLDGNCFFHYPMKEDFSRQLQALGVALEERFDPYVGRKLHHFMATCEGIEDIKVHAQPYHLVAGAASPDVLELWKLKLEGLRQAGERALGAAGYRDFVSLAVDHLQDPTTLTYSTLFTVWAKKSLAR